MHVMCSDGAGTVEEHIKTLTFVRADEAQPEWFFHETHLSEDVSQREVGARGPFASGSRPTNISTLSSHRIKPTLAQYQKIS